MHAYFLIFYFFYLRNELASATKKIFFRYGMLFNAINISQINKKCIQINPECNINPFLFEAIVIVDLFVLAIKNKNTYMHISLLNICQTFE